MTKLRSKGIKVKWLLCLMLTMLYSCAMANAEVAWTFEDQIDDVIAYEDGLMLLEGNRIWVCDPAMVKPLQQVHDGSRLSDEGELNGFASMLFTDEHGSLYALVESFSDAHANGILMLNRFSIVNQRTQIESSIQVPEQENAGGYSPYDSGFAQGSEIVLYGGQTQIYNTNIGKWKHEIWDFRRTAIPYRDGRVLSMDYVLHNGIYEKAIIARDTTTDEVETVAMVGNVPKALAYQAEKDQIVYFDPPIVYTVSALNDTVQAGYLPIISKQSNYTSCLTRNGYYALGDGNRLLITQLDSTFEQKQDAYLVITHFKGEGDETRRFREMYPGTPIITFNNGFDLTPAKVSELIRGQDAKTDIFMVRTFEAGYQKLLGKGFCFDLSQDETLCSLVDEMPPQISSAIMRGEKLLGVPTEIAYDNWLSLECNADVMDELQIDADALPASIEDLLDLILSLYERGMPSSIRLFNADDPAYELALFTARAYSEYMTIDTPYPDFDTPLFRALMARTEKILMLMNAQTNPAQGERWLLKYAYYDFAYADGKTASGNYYLTLPPQSGMPQRFPITMTVAVMNPLSKHKDIAFAYLRTIMNNLSCLTDLVFHPNRAVPVEKADYPEWRQLIVEDIQMNEKALSSSALDEALRRAFEEQLALAQQRLADLEENGRWLLSADDINTYLPLADGVCVANPFATHFWWDESMKSILKRFASGQVNSDQIIAFCLNRVLMMEKE